MDDTEKDIIEAKIKRDSQEDKVNDLLNWVEHIEKDRKHKVSDSCALALCQTWVFCMKRAWLRKKTAWLRTQF